MKKIFAVVLLTIFSINIHAQLLQGEGFEANKGFAMGIMGGAFGIYDDVSSAGIGLNATISGVYVDLLGWPRAHEKSTDVGYHRDEKTAFSVHAGYQFPLTTWFSIIPVVGYTTVKNGDTDGSNWRYNSGTGITNAYYVKDESQGFDYGGVLCFNINKVRIYAAGTRYGIYGGIGMKF